MSSNSQNDDDDDDDDDDDNDFFLWHGWPTKVVKPYFLPGSLSEILTITNLWHAASRIWTCAEPEFRLIWIKLCSSDNPYTTALQLLPKIKKPVPLLSICTDELIVTPKIMTFLPTLPSDNENSVHESNPIPLLLYTYLSRWVFLDNFSPPSQQSFKVKSESCIYKR